MTKEQLYEVLGGISEKRIMKADDSMKKNKKNYWIKLGAVAACLCLLIGGVTILSHDGKNEIDEVLDPIVADMAVFPENESIENVATATMNMLSEEEAFGIENLGEYLPTATVNGYCFGSAGIYRTSMKDGSIYYRLRANYSFVDNSSAESFEENMEEDILMLDYSVSVMNYKPKTENPIYTVDTVNLIPTDFAPNYTFIWATDNVYIEFVTGDLTYDELMSVLDSIR